MGSLARSAPVIMWTGWHEVLPLDAGADTRVGMAKTVLRAAKVQTRSWLSCLKRTGPRLVESGLWACS